MTKPNAKDPNVVGVYGMWLYYCRVPASEHEELPCEMCQLIEMKAYTPPEPGSANYMALVKQAARAFAEKHVNYNLVAVGTGSTFQVWARSELFGEQVDAPKPTEDMPADPAPDG